MKESSALTDRQRTEASVYDARVRDSLAGIRDEDLIVDPNVPPFPNRVYVEFLTFAFQRMGERSGARVLQAGSGNGDTVRWRIAGLQTERDHLVDYIQQ